MEEFADIFEQKVGCIPNFKCSLKLRQNAKPVFIKARDVPFALRDQVEKELDELVADNIIYKVEHSDWGSPLVPIPKSNDRVRLAVDYKVAVNKQLQDAHYPIPRVEDILNTLHGANVFCTLDLYKAYLHVQVDEESQIIQTMSTHRGTFAMRRLSFGIKTAPAEFHRILDQILSGLGGVTSYFDDVVIFGSTLEECQVNLINCLKRLRQYDLHVNREKCQFFKSSISYLGYVIEQNSVKKCPQKVKSILDAPKPSSVDEIRRFLGMITYYAKLIPNLSTLTYPLRRLLRKNQNFIWTSSCQQAFDRLKNEIASDRVLTPFNPDLPVVLACDASPTGIAAILSHTIDEHDRPIAFASRSLSDCEQNYSQLDREALAIVYAVNKFYMYLYGRKFTLVTDNGPLSRIFHHDAKLPILSASRLLRYATILSGFNYVIKHKKADQNVHVDYFSRSPIHSKTPDFNEDDIIQYQTINQISSVTITAESIKTATGKDPHLSQLCEDLKNGTIQDEQYSIQDGIVFRGNRVIIPQALRASVLSELHFTHVKTSKMKNLARRYCYWKNIDSDIELFVKSCQPCASTANTPAKTSIHPWEEPSSNFQRVHIDYAGPKDGYYIFILIDAKSKWPEIRLSKTAPTSLSTIGFLQDIFSVHGLPETMVSDNASIFVSNEFSSFCASNGICQRLIAPGHPQTNGQAERYVQFLKKKLDAMKSEPGTLPSKVRDILYRYRATPLRCGSTPAEIYLGRSIRTKLDLLRPINVPAETKSPSPTTRSCLRSFREGDRIQAKMFINNKEVWKPGVVVEKYGRLHYRVRLDDGYALKRHIDQLHRSEVHRRVTFDCPQEEEHHEDLQSGNTRTSQPASSILAPRTPQAPAASAAAPTPAAPQGSEYHLSGSPTPTPPRVAERQEELPMPRRSAREVRSPSYLDDYVRYS
ncbi:Hypothetical Protein NTJ_00130 [Nesidiocoris tenuis]|uniref:RNA-directed DNA polymerase n=1 Tax=Nesidiocoris tenuis TaxID=355587 RepID=A0ABN7A571_9HEMI|nr:Hypothetical Protein NTJ_00130 [Nesidiocoris tenuis]